jgi:hypothetical protein
MNQAWRRRPPKNFVCRISACDCFSRGNELSWLVGKPAALSQRHVRRRVPVSVEWAQALLSLVRVNRLQRIMRLNPIESHFETQKVVFPERAAECWCKLFGMSELSLALNLEGELTKAIPRCRRSLGIGLRRGNSTKFLELCPRGPSRDLRGQGLISTSEGRHNAVSMACDGRFSDRPNPTNLGLSFYPRLAPSILPKDSLSSDRLKPDWVGAA